MINFRYFGGRCFRSEVATGHISCECSEETSGSRKGSKRVRFGGTEKNMEEDNLQRVV